MSYGGVAGDTEELDRLRYVLGKLAMRDVYLQGQEQDKYCFWKQIVNLVIKMTEYAQISQLYPSHISRLLAGDIGAAVLSSTLITPLVTLIDR